VTTAAPSTALAAIQPAFTDPERLALAGYRGLTRDACTLDLRQFTTWCRARSLALFAVRRADIEGFARDLEARGRARATVTRRRCRSGRSGRGTSDSPGPGLRGSGVVLLVPQLVSQTARRGDRLDGEAVFEAA